MAYKKIKIANLLSEFAASENASDNVAQNANLRAFKVLMNALGVSMSEAQRFIDKGRLFCNGEVVSAKNEILRGEIELISYENAPRGQKPIFDNQNFAVFDKQSGILSHPNGRNCAYSLCDEIWHLYGAQAGVAHRLDRETSGLILVAKDKKTQTIFKTLFEKRLVKKEYLALVSGQTPLEFSVDLPMNSACDEVKTRMRLCPLSEGGKEARTEFKRLCYFSEQDLLNLSHEIQLGKGFDFSKGASLLLARPLTGRQHQIRLHLFASGFAILGEPLYGLERADIERILDKQMSAFERVSLTGATRLCLHSNRLAFEFGGKSYDILSQRDIRAEFLRALSL